MQFMLKIRAPIALSVKRARRWIYRNKHKKRVPDETVSKRRYKRALSRSMYRIQNNPLLFDEETFDVCVFTSRDVW